MCLKKILSRKYFLVFNIILFLFLLMGNTGHISAQVPYKSYTYNFYGNTISTPHAYIPDQIIDENISGIDNLDNPEDMFVFDNKIYLLDSGNHRIVILNNEGELEKIIDNFEIEDENSHFQNPKGIFISKKGNIYVADSGNERIVILNNDGNFIKKIEGLDSQILGEDFKFRPEKLGVDPAGRIYVVAEDVYEGLMQLDFNGEFMGYIGAPRITPDPVEYFWRRISTQEQRAQMMLYLPTKFSNLEVGEKGFIYTTVSRSSYNDDVYDEEVIRRLNPSGNDVLSREGFHPPVGDLEYPADNANINGSSLLVDITVRDSGIYSVLDKRRGRIFTYNNYGNLLYIFGNPGEIDGTFSDPVAIESLNDKLLVLDRSRGEITVFSPTEYAENIHKAIQFYNQGFWEKSEESWKKVLTFNTNSELAYTGIGRVLYQEEEYESAANQFKLGNNRQNYSNAFRYYRQITIERNLGYIFTVTILFLILLILYKKIKAADFIKNKFLGISKKVNKQSAAESSDSNIMDQILGSNILITILNIFKGLKDCFYIIFHPFAGFWELKNEEKGNVYSAGILIFMLMITYIFMRQYTGFVFRMYDLGDINILMEIASVVIPFSLWWGVNWGITTLLDGKGSLKEIAVSTAYSVVPAIIIIIPLTVISNYLTLEEAPFYYMGISLSIFWTIGLLFVATIVIHEYSLSKSVLIWFLIIVGIGIILFFSMLFFSIVNTLLAFLSTVYTELRFRL